MGEKKARARGIYTTTKPQQKPNGGTFATSPLPFAGAYAPGPLPPDYLAFGTMTLNRHLIREYISKLEWATVSNVCYVLNGSAKKRDYAIVATELNRMCRTKRKELRLKKLHHEFYTCYALATNRKTTLNHQHTEHDIHLRNCLGKYFWICGPGLLQFFTTKTFADGILSLNTGDLYFEFDSGHMGRKQLHEKLRLHYAGKGRYRVIFWMGTAEYAHWKNAAQIRGLERNRVGMFSEIVRVSLRHKPNRVLTATYHGYLRDGKLRSLKNYSVKP